MIPLSLYIHIPWCLRKCPYCDFNSHQQPAVLPEQAYIERLIADLEADLDHFNPTPIHSVFIGGGTPSLLSASAYANLFDQLRQRLQFEPDCEITLEANPGSIEQQRFKDYRALGINRLSIGIQSFNDQHLKALGRVHDSQQARRAIDSARLAGFDNINLDLMHGLPKQSIDEGLADLRQAIQCQPEHLSWYQLTLEPNTVFYKKPPVLPDEDSCADLEEAGFDLLNRAGFTRYEISAFCRLDKPARHNLNYWLFGDYLGIGAGAHGKISRSDGVWRTRKQRQPKDYLNPDKPACVEQLQVEEKTLLFEFMLNCSRLEQAIDYDLFPQRTGLGAALLQPGLQAAAELGLVRLGPTHWQITRKGRNYTNDLQALFLP